VVVGMTAPILEDIPLSRIKDGGAQTRVEKTSPDIINEYAEAMLKGDGFPPVILYFDGTDYWLGEGYHRVEATRKLERDSILADVRRGTARDAILCGIGSNATHGLRRTPADKRRAVERLLADPEWAQWSDRKIAEAAKVDHKTVAKIRREMGGEIPTGKSMGGEIPTGKSMGGEIPRSSGKPNDGGSILGDVLRSVSDESLLTECRRRGLVADA
jgi:hypothetical protein